MSGIAVIYRLDEGSVEPEDLHRMLDKTSHRGPDGTNIMCKEGVPSVGLGHCMLWTTPESLCEKLPLFKSSSKGSLAITADARIDNRDELAKLLDLPNRPLEKVSDSEFILAAYEKWDSDCPEHLLGDFAFVIWDDTKQQIFCARDHLGVKPFFYHYAPHHAFAVASEIKGLLCLDWIPCRLNETRIADYLTLMFEDQEITTFQEIVRLPPATRMWVDAAGIRSETYWELDPNRELTLASDEAYAESFQKIFTEAVRCRLRSAFPIGTHLSGGLDSSSVTCVARNILDKTTGETLHTFSNIFDTVTECDERPYIDQVLAQRGEQGGYEPHYVHADTFGPLTDIEQIWQYEDEPLLGPSHYYLWRLNQAACKANVKVVCDGFDGDTTISHGIDRLSELARQQKWNEFEESLEVARKNYGGSRRAMLAYYGLPQLREFALRGRWLAFVRSTQYIHRHFRYSRRSLYVQQGIRPLLKSFVSIFHRRQEAANINEVVSDRLAASVNLSARINKYQPTRKQQASVREIHWQSITTGLMSLSLERVDRTAAAFSIESRHPFLDRRLIEFCLAVPSNQKFDKGFGRVIMRRGLKSVLPKAIGLRGDKTSMSPNFLNGLLNVDRQLFEKVLKEQQQAVAPYVSTDRWLQGWQRTKESVLQHKKVEATVQDRLVVWRSTALALWLQHNSKTLDL